MNDLGVKDPVQILKECKDVVNGHKTTIERNYILGNEEAVVVTSYTYEDKINGTSPYRIINEKLREGKAQDQFINKKSYLRLLLRALRKLPRTKPQTLYRGIRGDEHKYKVGEEIEWKGFSSTTASMKVTQRFLNFKGKVEGTLFEIRNVWGYNISDFSKYTEEGDLINKQWHKLLSHVPLRNSFGADDEV